MSSDAPDFSLPGWNASLGAIGMATDRSRTRSLFYLGDDKVLREAIAIQNTWQITPNRSESVWPLADNPSDSLAVAYQQSQGKTWIYYWSNETIVQAHKNSDGEWEDAIVLPQTVPKNETQSDNSDNSDNSDKDKDKAKSTKEDDTTVESTGLTSGAKAGIGVGVAVGALALGALIWFFMKRRRNNQAPQEEEVSIAEAGGTPITSPAPKYEKDTFRAGDEMSPSEMSGDGRPAELDNNPSVVYELPGNHTK
jgi:hypothetical protein